MSAAFRFDWIDPNFTFAYSGPQQQVRNQMQPPHPGQISQGTPSNHSEQHSGGGFVPQSKYNL